ncbi:bifunctional riboflavin kinase/FAD synthetase [Homoserinibacter sp. GY 40078]|uniref:bifunctional riboflavin kinase/FAD synthetase n=1 Tax=Homoserinibacter sp. GY 40078 TaxID=2603275 RepID=UPI0011C83D73|nr:bifunctional riboflavin kinase/FAD synthetase [Homoserinibacter sp. GY 40078]TXK17325.1 bifunctional riboflavin kinase/FAD synthetase [Homoserinibacter sp. GY 40078]
MLFFEGLDAVPAEFGPSAVTIGKFDGLHTGHRAVIGRLRSVAAERGLASVVVTFDRHPLSLLAPAFCPEPLVSNAQKRELLADAGVDATLMLTFDQSLADLDPADFVRRVLVDALGARVILAGGDFRFGRKGAGDVALLTALGAELGFEVVPIDDVRAGEDRPDAAERRASSTWVREALESGRVAEAARVLGRLPQVRSVVIEGERRGRELGYPTANLDPDRLEGFLPADGVYAAWADVDGIRYPAAVSIGNNPTFEGVPQHQAEAHLLDVDIDLYGRTLELAFVDFVRGMRKFDSLDELVAAIDDDALQARRILGIDE